MDIIQFIILKLDKNSLKIMTFFFYTLGPVFSNLKVGNPIRLLYGTK